MAMEYLKWIMPSIKNRSLKKVPGVGEFNFRLDMARQQADLDTVDRQVIINHVNDFLKMLGMKTVDEPRIKPKDGETRKFEYCKYNEECKEDIVWIKFTDDNFISVIGTGCDISFSDYAKKNTVAGIINTELHKEWDKSEVLIFPLHNIPDGLNRSDIESGIGNYLISKGVPVLDYYSHNY